MAVVTVDRVSSRAAEVDVRAGLSRLVRWLLTGLALALWAVGWLAAQAVTLTVRAVLWSVAAVVLGWRDARPKPPETPSV